MIYTKIVHMKSSYFFQIMHSINFHGPPEVYTVRKFYEMSTLSVNNIAIDINPLVRF